jgi:hypothetical protein
MVEKCLNKETNMDVVLSEIMLQLEIPAAHTVRIPAGEARGFTLLNPPKACCNIQPRKGLRF